MQDSKAGRGLFGLGARPGAAPTPQPVRQSAAAASAPDALIGLNLRALAAAAVLTATRGVQPPAPPALELAGLDCRPIRYADALSGWYGYWARALLSEPRPHRKLWEFIAVLQAFYEAGVMVPGARTLCFGAAGDPLPSYLASLGMAVVATDLPGAADREAMFNPGIVDGETFDRLVEVSNLDMRRLDDPTLRGFDACWSSSVLGQMASVDEAMDTAIGAMDVLKPGGVAVHTVDYAFAEELAYSPEAGMNFTRNFLERLAANLNGRGHSVAPLDFGLGDHPLDAYVDLEPFEADGADAWTGLWAGIDAPHLKLRAEGVMKTSFVFIVKARA